MGWLANGCYALAALAYLPVLGYQMLFQRKNRRGWSERFGAIPERRDEGPCIWIHAVSLGEVNATRLLVAELRAERPDLQIVISTTTDTGTVRAKQLYPDLQVFRFPLDFTWIVRRVLRRVRPTVLVLMELELWYNLVTRAASCGVAVCVANGRFTERSSRRLSRLRGMVRPMFTGLSWVGAQTPEIAARFKSHGAKPAAVEVLGSMKWDTATVADNVPGADELARSLGLSADRPLVVLGSSGPGEEHIVVDAWSHSGNTRSARLVIVPRKPERFDEVARALQRDGHTVIRRSERPDGVDVPSGASDGAIILGDTMGELRKFCVLADVVIVGRSLVPMGGSDPMEVAALGRPILIGPHATNFADPVGQLQAGDALVVVQPGVDLQAQLNALLADPERGRAMGRRGQDVVRRNQGVTARTVKRVLSFVPAASS